MVIKRVNPLSAAKVGGVLYALLGLVIGAVVSLVAVAFSGAMAAASDQAGGSMFGMLFGAGAIIILPICYGVIGFIGTLISAALYNLAARFAGGIEVEAA
ncbi:MAG TPA: hypothetical protein VLT86_13235 [Vicinamibacterales bacterium]|nr:hypothetical protein [Vicinamibacterales bacterium]